MLLHPIDWAIVAVYFLASLIVGVAVTRRASRSAADFFAGGRAMPWWLLGVSLVATTFSTDTPNLVTNMVRKNGVAGNWEWWAFLLTGMLTAFLYARLWKRSGVLTDVEFYELRYSGKPAAFLRGFRALYLGIMFNIVIMASVSLAAIKIGRVLLDLSPMQTILIASVVTAIYSALGGLLGVLWTDFFQFILAMIGSIAAAYYALSLPEIGGLAGLLAHENVQTRLSLLPNFNDPSLLLGVFLIPLCVQWWAAYYPGAEPGGGGYVAQRMLAAKNEKHALGAVFLFNAAHYALRPWPWIIVALCSLVVFPDLDAMRARFPNAGDVINHDMGYPAMLTFLPVGLLGMVVASLIAAYMSTIATHLNWGASYLVNDFYKRFLRPRAGDRELV
ncbi:MAG TPA: Na+:solute symporter, partial [Candidatus Hydrogenedentes bacterium]|nr:Na+:solute symporter [Candidatus Hydrogenedentota bacterium]